MDREQQERFREAVEKKKEEAERRSHAHPGEHGHAGGLPDENEAHITSQDVPSVREKSSGHGKKTADKWNQ